MSHEVRMPALSQSMLQGQIVEWLVEEGTKIEKGDPLVLVESDKSTSELEAPQTGILQKILEEVGADVDVGAPIAIIADANETDADLLKPPPLHTSLTGVATRAASRPLGERTPASPAAKRLSRELGIDLTKLPGTGEGGLVTEGDVRAFADERLTTAQTERDDAQIIPFTGKRGRIAERMALSRRTAADVTTIMDVNMRRIVDLRSMTPFSYTAYVAWATARALREFPLLNSWVAEDRVIVKRSVHLGVAVALDDALVVPVLRDADTKSIGEIDQEIKNLSSQAREDQLTPDDMKGSTFTLTNSGVFGSLFFTPIINLPEAAILGMGKVTDAPVVEDGKVVVGKVMYLSLSYDHRAVDGAVAVQFLRAVQRRLENFE